MKAKTDFVTNSSTTSFVVIGARIDPEDVPDEVLLALIEKKGSDWTVEELREDFGEALWDISRESDLDYACRDYDDNYMIGISYDKMEEDETLAQFRTRVVSTVKELLGIDINPRHIEEAWRDG